MNNIARLGGMTNAVVVQLPERKLPGVVIQQDSLQNLVVLLSEAESRIAANDLEEATGIIRECLQITQGYIQAFSQHRLR